MISDKQLSATMRQCAAGFSRIPFSSHLLIVVHDNMRGLILLDAGKRCVKKIVALCNWTLLFLPLKY